MSTFLFLWLFIQAKASKLLDICSCKCVELNECSCTKDRKVPRIEHDFLIDQRTTRVMYIADIDKPTTERMMKHTARKERERELVGAAIVNSIVPQNASSANRRYLKRKPTNKASRYSTAKIQKASQVADRRNLPDVAVSEIISAVLTDYGIVNADDSSQVIDRRKINRHRQKNRSEQMQQHEHHEINLKTIYFERRMDKTKSRVNGKTTTSKEDHYSLIEEPGSYFLGFFSLKAENEQQQGKTKAVIVRDKIVEYLQVKNISVDDLKAVGCDGTNLNTGIRGRHYSIP